MLQEKKTQPEYYNVFVLLLILLLLLLLLLLLVLFGHKLGQYSTRI